MKNLILIGAIALLVWSSYSCNKDDCKAGLGGKVRLFAYPEHHGNPIPNLSQWPDTAFIKFDSQSFPGSKPEDYDLVVSGVPGSNYVMVEGLQCGNYYIFMAGYDTNFAARVVGGIPFRIDLMSGDYSLTVPVTEGD